jgi:hypothetical protein
MQNEPQSPVERPEVVLTSPDGKVGDNKGGDNTAGGVNADDAKPNEVIEHPSKIMRIGTMIRTLLEEARAADLDESGRDRLRDIYDTSIHELSETMSPDLQEELSRLALPFGEDGEPPSASELRVAQAQLVGWLEGLFLGIQAPVFAQQMAARQQLEAARQGLPRGGPADLRDTRDGRPGTYL